MVKGRNQLYNIVRELQALNLHDTDISLILAYGSLLGLQEAEQMKSSNRTRKRDEIDTVLRFLANTTHELLDGADEDELITEYRKQATTYLDERNEVPTLKRGLAYEVAAALDGQSGSLDERVRLVGEEIKRRSIAEGASHNESTAYRSNREIIATAYLRAEE